MEAHEQRVVDERRARQQELEKLDAFRFRNPIFDTLPKEDQNLLRMQSHVMVMLVDVLSQRIARFK